MLARVLSILAMVVVLLAQASPTATAQLDAPYRAFTATSYWNTPVPNGVDSHNAAYIKWLKSKAPQGITFGMGDWAMPVYWAQASDKLVTINPDHGPTVTFHRPSNMTAMAGNDAAVVVFDLASNQSLQFFEFDPITNTASGSARYWLDGNGIADSVDGMRVGDDGHRGIPGAVHMVRRDEVLVGLIAHRLKVALPGTGSCGVYPMSGYEKNKGGIICEGMVMHIKPSVDLIARGLRGGTLVIATALQKYGALVGDNGGGSKVSLKLERTDWSGIDVKTRALFPPLTWDDFVFSPAGWGK